MIILFILSLSRWPALFLCWMLCPNLAADLQLPEPYCLAKHVCFSCLTSSTPVYISHFDTCFLSKAKCPWLVFSLRSVMIPKSFSQDPLPLQFLPVSCLLSVAQMYICTCCWHISWCATSHLLKCILIFSGSFPSLSRLFWDLNSSSEGSVVLSQLNTLLGLGILSFTVPIY